MHTRELSLADVPALAELVATQLAAARYPFDASLEVMRCRAEQALGNDGMFADRRRWLVHGAFEGSRLTSAVRAYAVDHSVPSVLSDDEVPADICWLVFAPDRDDAGA